MKHLVIKYFDTFPQHKYYFETKEEAIAFAEERDGASAIYEYEYIGEIDEIQKETSNCGSN